MGRTRTRVQEDVVSRTVHWSYVLPSSHCRDFHLLIPCLNLYEFNLGLENDGWNTEAWRHDERLQFRDKLAGICFHSAVSPPTPCNTLYCSMPLTTKKNRFPYARLIFQSQQLPYAMGWKVGHSLPWQSLLGLSPLCRATLLTKQCHLTSSSDIVPIPISHK